MAPKRKTSKRPGLVSSAKRPIKGPSQALCSPAPNQSLSRIQSMVTGLAGDPAALAHVEAEMDGLLHRCSTPSTSSARPAPPAGASSLVSSSSEEEREFIAAGGFLPNTVAQTPDLPKSQAAMPKGQGGARGTPRRRASAQIRAVQAAGAPPPAAVRSVSGHSQVISFQSIPGTAQQGDASESSVEDSLLPPPRPSSGGHRRRKKSSRRRAKRRRRDTSSSPSGTSSSSSSSDEEASLKLYWGFGESTGLPKWAWERRANSHRAKYGAVQDCRDGVLVPEVKVATNSVRDLIPGAHLTTKLRSRILDGRYIDIFSLAPPQEGQDPQDKGSTASKKRAVVAKVDRTFERWLDSFQVFAGVVSAAYPRRSLHLWVYLSIVRSAFTMAGESAAISYDENFRRRAAKIPTARWDRKDLDVWTTFVAPRIDRKASEPQKSKAVLPRVGRKLFCWDFNKGTCL
ncbi:Hypothetical predicted protein [Podarcis lilfordi]|uniref:Uncharacterized protein n=1 Tax=Podarcis lilfordi TaxID=74358 RepID=A0AA35PBE1_9SAUR|nr:Hypothetical predicted protein [Podarcis lilfordi]